MKKYLIVSFALLGFLTGTTQSISGQAFVEQTIMGLQKGYGLRVQNGNGLGVGILFQSNGKISGESEWNYPLYAIETIVPFSKCSNIQFFFTPKIGFVNDNFLVFIPQVETKIKIAKMFSAGVTAGIRARQSSVGVKGILHL